MDGEHPTVNRPAAWAALAALAVALAMAGLQAAREWPGGAVLWVSVAAGVAGTALAAVVVFGREGSSGCLAVLAAPVCCLVLATADKALSREAWYVARLAVSLVAAGAYLVVGVRLAPKWQYAAGYGALGVSALFFTLWEPPPPKPVPVAKSLHALEADLLKAMPGWTGHHRALAADVEKVLGADEYLNLELTPPQGDYRVLVFVTYNANAMSNIPHVPWVCMTQAGFKLVEIRQDDIGLSSRTGQEIQPNVILFDGGQGREGVRALMFQYFNVGGTYTPHRQLARFLATSGSLGRRGSYLSQTQVAVWLPPAEAEDPLAKASRAYRTGLTFLDVLVRLLERDYYPDLRGPEGG
jgi:hypothetical protein